MGSRSNNAAREAERSEQQRQAAIRAAQGSINRVFDDPRRQAEIADAVSAQRELLTGDLNRQKAEQDLQLKFALARNGVLFGSTQNDQQAKLADAYGRGLLEVDRAANEVGAGIQAADQQARGNLLSLATQGLDITTGASQAAAAMRTNLEAGRSVRTAGAFDLAAGTMSDFIKRSREIADRRRADQVSGFGYYARPYGG